MKGWTPPTVVSRQTLDERNARGRRWQTLERVGLAVGATALAGAVICFFLDDPAAPTSTALLVAPTPGGLTAGGRWTF